jgi:hypothetical protein
MPEGIGSGPMRPRNGAESSNETELTPISDEVRARWKDTWLREGQYVLVDEDGEALARVPANAINQRHYDRGPEQNDAAKEVRFLEQVNADRRSRGQPEYARFEDFQRDAGLRRTELPLGPAAPPAALPEAPSGAETEPAPAPPAAPPQRDAAGPRAAAADGTGRRAGADQNAPTRPAAPRPAPGRGPERKQPEAQQRPELSHDEQLKRLRAQRELERQENEAVAEGNASRLHIDDTDTDENRRKFRRSVLETTDPASFERMDDGRYRHPGLPGYTFTEAELNWAASDRSGEPLPGDGGEPTPERIVRPPRGAEAPQGARAPMEWVVRDNEAFRGLKAKRVDEILANPRDEMGFSRLVEALHANGLDIKRRSPSGDLTKEEMQFLEYARHEYARRSKQLDFINSKISLRDLEVVARRDPDFAALMGARDPARVLEIFKNEMFVQGMGNKEKLDSLYHTYERLTDLREGEIYKRWEAEIHALCQERGITIDDFRRTYLGTNEQRAETERAIQGEYRKDMSPLRGYFDFDFLPNSSKKMAALRMATAQALDAQTRLDGGTLQKVDANLDALTRMLRMTLIDDPRVYKVIQQEAFQGRKITQSREDGPRTWREASERIEPTTTEIQNRLDSLVRNHRTGDGRSWDYMTKRERESALAPIDRDYSLRVYESGSSWFASAFRVIWEMFWKKKRDEIINKRAADE